MFFCMGNIDFPTWLQNELNARGWSQADLVRTTKLSTGSISHLLTGMRNPGPEACNALAKAFGYSAEMVFRVAGLLPAKSESGMDEETEKVLHLFQQLDESDQEAVIGLAQFLIDRRTGKARNVARPAEG